MYCVCRYGRACVGMCVSVGERSNEIPFCINPINFAQPSRLLRLLHFFGIPLEYAESRSRINQTRPVRSISEK